MGTEHMHWKELLKSGHKLETCRNSLKKLVFLVDRSSIVIPNTFRRKTHVSFFFKKAVISFTKTGTFSFLVDIIEQQQQQIIKRC